MFITGLILHFVLGSFSCRQSTNDASRVFAQSSKSIFKVSTDDGNVGTGFAVYEVLALDVPAMPAVRIRTRCWLFTCAHVVASSEHVNVSGKSCRVVASDPNMDIAVIDFDPPFTKAVRLDSKNDTPVGARVFVIGNPLGILDKSLADGLVSRYVTENARTLVQVTAPVSVGSSGSPVLNSKSRVVGMITSTLKEGQSLNFAISSKDLSEFIWPILSDWMDHTDGILTPLINGQLAKGGHKESCLMTTETMKLHVSPSKSSRVIKTVPSDSSIYAVPVGKTPWIRVLLGKNLYGFGLASQCVPDTP